MRLASLEADVRAHTGQFYCERIDRGDEKKVVNFRHKVSAPRPAATLPEVGRLRAFYETFGSAVFYADDRSGDAAKYIAGPSDWSVLRSDFTAWFDHLRDEERAEIWPAWLDNKCLVIGEVPATGNYLLMPATGNVAGHIFLFDHDGFEFTYCASDLVDYVEKLLAPNDQLLLEMASHMRFIEGDESIQWWIRELRDNRGNEARTYL